MKVVIAGGGTGGHLFPGISLANVLTDKGIEFLFMVSNRGIDRSILSKFGYDFYEQNIYAFKGKNITWKIKTLLSIIKESIKVFNKIDKRDIVILLGGFASVPTGIVSILKRNPLYIHEQNSVMGIANRFFSKFAKKVFLSFEKTKFAPKNAIVVGNPIRKEFYEIEAKENFEKHLLIVGGSQGSRIINKFVSEIAKDLLNKGYSIYHQTGEKLYNETVNFYEEKGVVQGENIKIEPFIDNMVDAYKWSDIVISRAGAGAVFELMYSRRIGIFIPLKIAADNHQFYNALHAKENGVAEIITEDDLSKESMIKTIDKIEKDYSTYRENLLSIKRLKSAEIICEEILSA